MTLTVVNLILARIVLVMGIWAYRTKGARFAVIHGPCLGALCNPASVHLIWPGRSVEYTLGNNPYNRIRVSNRGPLPGTEKVLTPGVRWANPEVAQTLQQSASAIV